MVTSISLDMPPINLSISSIIDFMVDTYEVDCFKKVFSLACSAISSITGANVGVPPPK